MATKIYNSAIISTVDGEQIYITPLKIKYLRLFMDQFKNVQNAVNDNDAFGFVSQCALIAMMQYKPDVKTIEEIEDLFDLPTLYKVLEIAGGITIKEPQEAEDKTIKEQANSEDNNSWETIDLAKLEAEAFLLGIWKDYEELESSLSMPELSETLNAKREESYAERKFLAALKGIDIDGNGKQEENAWEKLKNKVMGGGKNPNDVTSLQGAKARQAGFGIGMGLSYEKI